MSGAMIVFESVEMRVIDAGEIHRLAVPRQADPLVEKQAIARRLHTRHHADGVVVSKDRIDRA